MTNPTDDYRGEFRRIVKEYLDDLHVGLFPWDKITEEDWQTADYNNLSGLETAHFLERKVERWL